MHPEDWQKAKTLIAEALQQPPDERAGFLAHACPDPALCAEIEALLQHAADSDFLASYPAEAATNATLSPGTRLGAYEIVSLLGAGGMGQVYRAHDTRLDRDVAVKVLPRAVSRNPDRVRRFEQEARASARLEHPHIVPVYDVGVADDIPYIVSERLEGQSLRACLTGGSLETRRAVRYAIQIADGLSAAHDRGIVHRDVKPDNIFITTDDRVKILDFGIAKLLETTTVPAPPAAVATSPGGTAPYMSPEQVRGGPIDARSDVFAFGSVLFEMLSGRRAFDGATTAEIMAAVLGDEPQDISAVSAPPLEALIRQCLEKLPEQRFQSMRDVRTALESLTSADGSESALSPSLQSSGKKIFYVSAAALLAVIITGVVLWFRAPARTVALTDRDVLVVADFQNNTGDSVFDTALKQALAFQLQQSPFLKAMDDEDIREALKLAGRSPEEPLTGQRAREVCVRDGQKATLEGSISRLGSAYLLSLQAVNCRTGESLAREQAEAADREHVVEALGRATGAMRAKLGESLPTVKGADRVYEQPLTTSSLEALEAVHLGAEAWVLGSSSKALSHFLYAAQLDPNFAMAYAVAGTMYDNFGDSVRWREFTEKAYSLIDQVRSERERLFILAQHYSVVGDERRSAETYEVLTRMFPRDSIFHGNLANIYNFQGRFQDALAEAETAIWHSPKFAQGYTVAFEALAGLNRPREAKAMLAKAFARGLDHNFLHEARLHMAYVESDVATEENELSWFAGKPEQLIAISRQIDDALARGKPGKARRLATSPDEKSDIELLERAGRLSSRSKAPIDPALTKFANEPMSPNPNVLYAHALRSAFDGNYGEAANLFQRILDNRYRNWSVYYPLAYVGLARAASRASDTARARKAYEDFFALWKDAEPGVALLAAARREYAALP